MADLLRRRPSRAVRPSTSGDRSTMSRRVLALTTSPLPYGDRITDGPGYRMWNLLHVVAAEHEVHILSLYESFHEGRRDFGSVSEDGIPVETIPHTPESVARRIRALAPDVLYLPWSSTMFLGRSNRDLPTVLDFVGPGLLESYVSQGHVPLPLLRLQLESFRHGDFFMTTSERERYYLLGLLAASERLSMGDLRPDDPLIHVVRMSHPVEPPTAAQRRPERKGDELVVLLGGSFLPWYDYSLLAAAIERLAPDTRSALRVVVLGGNPRMPEVEAQVRRTLSRGASHDVVEFTGLVPFKRRSEYYLGADAALSIAPETVEDELSSRTRIVDCLWAHLPVITPGRDEYSALLLQAGAGFRYDPRPEGLAEILERVVADRSLLTTARSRIDALLSGPFNPKQAAAPFLEFIESPRLSQRMPARWGGPARAGLWVRDLVKSVRTGRM